MNRDQANKFFDAAVADGWSYSAMYHDQFNVPTVKLEHAAKLVREGWVMQIYRYEPTVQGSDMTDVAIWGPDGLAVTVPEEYDWEILKGLLDTCMYCHATNCTTFRVGFAGRCCESCLPEQRKVAEFPGWTN